MGPQVYLGPIKNLRSDVKVKKGEQTHPKQEEKSHDVGREKQSHDHEKCPGH